MQSSLISILSSLLLVSALPGPNVQQGCRQLAAKFPKLTFTPGTTEYSTQIINVWSQTCIIEPYCVFEPETAQQVASALGIFTATNTKFAVRSGGHMPVPGANSIADGVLVSLNRMTAMSLSRDKKVASLGPGLRWAPVYEWLYSQGVLVNGGRFSDVGVGGILLGGGLNFWGSQYGWSSSNVRNFQVALANGQLVEANANGPYSDLFWALKGGSSNFGIVTRFDVNTFTIGPITGGLIQYPYSPENHQGWVDAVAHYVEPTGGSSDVRASMNPVTVVTPSLGEVTVIGSWFSYNGAETSPAAFENFTTMDALFNTMRVSTEYSDFQSHFDLPDILDRSNRHLFSVTAMKAKAASVYLANPIFLEHAFEKLKNVPNCTTSINYALVTQNWLAASRRAGGDSIDLDPAKGGFVQMSIESIWEDEKYDAQVNQYSRELIAAFDKASKAAGLHYPFTYINEAGTGQTPFSTYGDGKSLGRLRSIAHKYDPKGVFQKLLPGGFKVSVG